MWEAVIVLGATVIGALIVYLVYRHQIGRASCRERL